MLRAEGRGQKVPGLFVAGCSLCITALAGCGPGFQPGPGESPLDGAVINHDGRTILLSLALDLDSLASATISGNDGTRSIQFMEPIGGVAVPEEIRFDPESCAGNCVGGSCQCIPASSVLLIDQVTEEVTFLPELTGTLPQELTATRSFLMPEARTPAHAGDCDEVVESISEFCDRFSANREASLTELTVFALELAEIEMGASAPGAFIQENIRDCYEVLGIFCDGFTEVVDGTADSDPVDICVSVRDEEEGEGAGEGAGPP